MLPPIGHQCRECTQWCWGCTHGVVECTQCNVVRCCFFFDLSPVAQVATSQDIAHHQQAKIPSGLHERLTR